MEKKRQRIKAVLVIRKKLIELGVSSTHTPYSDMWIIDEMPAVSAIFDILDEYILEEHIKGHYRIKQGSVPFPELNATIEYKLNRKYPERSVLKFVTT